MKLGLLIIMVTTMTLVSCGGLPQNEAESAALKFVDANVKFYARTEDQSQVNVTDYSSKVSSATQEGDSWRIVVTVSATVDSVFKESHLDVLIDKQGRVTEFNGVSVTRS